MQYKVHNGTRGLSVPRLIFTGMVMGIMLILVMSIQIGQMWPTRTSKGNVQMCKYCEIKLAFTRTTVNARDTNPIYL